MLSPTNYHIPSHVAEGLAEYHTGRTSLEDVIPEAELNTTLGILAEITNPHSRIEVSLGQVAGHTMLLIDDHARPKRDLGILR